MSAVARPTVSRHWVVVVADALEASGFACRAWLAKQGYGPGVLAADGRVPWELPVRMWRAAARAVRDPVLGLHVAERVPTSAPDQFAYMALSSATLREVFESFVRYQDLLTNAGAMTLGRRGDDFGCRPGRRRTEPSRFRAPRRVPPRSGRT